MGLLKEFRDFALRGNVIDLAVGVIIGGAFGKITSSLVGDVMMPALGLVANNALDFKSRYIRLFSAEQLAAATKTTTEEANKLIDSGVPFSIVSENKLPVIAYGSFLTTVIDFAILAFCVFMVVKIMNTAIKRLEALRKAEVAAAPPAEPPAQEKLLMEIRDLLKAK
ncbi:large conductance mechanosensitive channel protein [Pirellula staleyi DSM 6068]|uniref:Large-conductance mechanosensitive channel n=1 Tax=Pirellula staleyi (strain ATCC 27377 / DSM 6068 / ICPB 4128) TaxID=530564 RepID=D2R1B6_PIRSD|nr:large conductance mechanosensitive channel protein MscL [Pirellula staleyi]ADB14901.1 large conductance mechanosensitive channel protein [Pirellula staleyi DSM 6068]